jgi:hypothetical protein
MAGYYEHGTEVMGFKKQTPHGPAQQQSALQERKILSIQLEVGVEIPPRISK